MKKIFSTLSLLAIVLLAGTSCSNDEIEINDSQLTFTINLSNVMKYDGVDIIENICGSNAVQYLKEVPVEDGRHLRVRNLIYDNNGILKKETEDFASSYNQTIQPKILLPEGKYTVITLTDMVTKDDNGKVGFHFWDVKDSTILGNTRLVPTGYIGRFQSLGFAKTEIEVGGSVIKEVKPSPVGSMIYVRYQNIKEFKINGKVMDYLAIVTKHHPQYFYFNTNKNLTLLEEVSDTYDWRFDYIEPNDYVNSQYSFIYDFTFIVACDAHPVGFYGKNTSGTTILFTGHGQTLTCNFKPGVMYAVEVPGKNYENYEDAEMFVGTAREYEEYRTAQESTQKMVRAAQPQLNLFKSANTIFQPAIDLSHRSGYSINELEKSSALH